MQTFLTRYGLHSAACDLDPSRLGKQRVEAKQIAMYHLGQTEAWGRHPAVQMWTGHELALLNYGAVMCYRFWQLGYRDNLLPWFERESRQFRADFPDVKATNPPWMRDKEVILSHRSNLVRKMPERYGRIFPSVAPDRPYLWPVVLADGTYRLYLARAEAQRVDPKYLPDNWVVDWETREVCVA